MVVAWAHAENMMFSTFARVAGIGLNMAMESYLSLPTFESRTKFILALIAEWEVADFDAKATAEAVQKLAKLAATRNAWVHGDWCASGGKKETVVFNHRVPAESVRRRKPVKAHDIMDHVSAVKKRAKALGSLIKWDELRA